MVALRHKTQTMGNALRRIFRMVGNEQQLRLSFRNQYIHKATHQLPVEGIESLQRLIQNQQRGMFYQRAGDKHQPLLSPGETVKRRIGLRLHA